MKELDSILERVESLNKSEAYRRLYTALKTEHLDSDDCTMWVMKQPRIILEETQLQKGLKAAFSGEPIKHYVSRYLLALVLAAYNSQKNERLHLDDIQKVYNLYERILTYTEDFGRHPVAPIPARSSYDALRRLRWSKEARRLQSKIIDRRSQYLFSLFGLGSHVLLSKEKGLTYVAACRAIRRGSSLIREEDVIAAWEAYSLLLSSDLPKLGVAYDPSDHELNSAFASLGEYRGVKYRDLLERMRETKMVA
jgi:hypothetical protein